MPYRYLRADCHRPPAQLLHVDLLLRFFEDRVEGEETLLLEMREPGDSLTLDAAALQVGPAFLLGEDGGEEPLSTLYDKEANRLALALPHCVAAGGRLRIRLSAVSRPSESLLEGIYRDTTPAGAPPQFISQCQQWGFQRIMPILDDCTAKCTWRTTLEGDARYTHLISNGDVDRTANPSGVPVRIPGEPQRQRITYVNPIPMPPYLFIAAAGTWDVLADEVTTPGGRRVRLEYLVPPGQVEGARIPMQILKDSILWQARHVGYEYCRECYRTICMEKSNFGGMENVGNTTIITEAALLDRWTTDRRLVYAYGVIVHEYEHNHCGSDVTMETPFDMWLNEAYTVTVEQAYLAARFGADAARLDELDGLRDPLRGPLSAEDAGAAAPIVREGFDHPDDVVDGVTYQKAPEVLGMLRMLLGDARYRQATGTYFATYNGGNATTEQFLDAFRAVAPDPALLDRFFSGWLFTAGYPVLTGSWRYDAATRVLTLALQQRGNVDGIGPFVIPFRVRACAGGAVLPGTERLLVLDGAEQTWEIPGVATAPDFIDWNGGLPFYGKFRETSATPAAGELAARFHPSLTGRAEAFSALTEQAVLREMQARGRAG